MGSRPNVEIRSILAHFLLSFLALWLISNTAYAADSTIENCKSLTSPEWMPQEIWVWEKLCGREDADFNTLEGIPDAQRAWMVPLDTWDEYRILSSRFLSNIILDEPFASALSNRVIQINGAWYQEEINFDGARIRNFLSLLDSRFDGPIYFRGSDIDARVELMASWFRNEFEIFNSTISKDLIIAEARFDRGVNLANNIGDMSIVLQDTEFFGYVNLSGSRLNEVVVGTQGQEPVWSEDARLSMRGTFLNILVDSVNSWNGLEGKLDLQGLTYQRFTGIADSLDASTGAESSSERPVGDLIRWLEMQEDRERIFIPQPYEQLASALYDLGQNSKADRILYAKNDYWRQHATTPLLDKLWLTIKKVVIGYGYQVWLTILWFFLLICAGALVLRFSIQGRNQPLLQCLLYSLDQAIPLVDLQPLHEDIARQHSIRLQGYYLTHQIFSLILISFLGAGLAGAIG